MNQRYVTPCPDCHGTGSDPTRRPMTHRSGDSAYPLCRYCAGTGRHREPAGPLVNGRQPAYWPVPNLERGSFANGQILLRRY